MRRGYPFLMIIMCAMVLFMSCLICNGISYASTPEDVLRKIESLKSEALQQKLKEAGFASMPKYISVRIYKLEKTLEIWAGRDDVSDLKILARYPICAMDFLPGPKLREGDERTPEGSFALKEHYNSRNWYMHIDLRPGMIENEGDENSGDSFYFCTDYPTSFNKALSRSVNISRPGSAICIHGNCASVGCPSLVNEDFVEVYYWIMQHDKKKFGAPQVHILPFLFYEECSPEDVASESMFCSTELKAALPGFVVRKLKWQIDWMANDRALANNRTCIVDNRIQMKPYCPSSRFKKISAIVEYSANINKESKVLGEAMIKKLWMQMAASEKAFLSSPKPVNADLGLTKDLLK